MRGRIRFTVWAYNSNNTTSLKHCGARAQLVFSKFYDGPFKSIPLVYGLSLHGKVYEHESEKGSLCRQSEKGVGFNLTEANTHLF
jgi:hypothetical protein